MAIINSFNKIITILYFDLRNFCYVAMLCSFLLCSKLLFNTKVCFLPFFMVFIHLCIFHFLKKKVLLFEWVPGLPYIGS